MERVGWSFPIRNPIYFRTKITFSLFLWEGLLTKLLKYMQKLLKKLIFSKSQTR